MVNKINMVGMISQIKAMTNAQTSSSWALPKFNAFHLEFDAVSPGCCGGGVGGGEKNHNTDDISPRRATNKELDLGCILTTVAIVPGTGQFIAEIIKIHRRA